MIIPVRCFTCGKLLADKWEYYAEEAKKIDDEATAAGVGAAAGEAGPSKPKEPQHKNIAPGYKGKLLDTLGLDRLCCRRHMISHVDLIDVI